MQLAKRFLQFVFLLLTCLNCFAQDPQYIQFGINDGLPSPELYHSIVDKFGNLIITSDRGIAKYNGYEFVTYSTEDGLLDNTNFRIIAHGNEFWFLGYNGKITILENGEFRSHPINVYTDTLQNFTWWEDVIFINDQDYYLIENEAEPKDYIIATFKDQTFYFNNALPEFKPIENKLVGRKDLVGARVRDRFMMKTTEDKYIVRKNREIVSFPIEPAEPIFEDYNAFYIRRDITPKNEYNAELVSRIYFFRENEVAHTFEDNRMFNAIFSEEKSILWGCSEEGLYKFWKENDTIENRRYFEDLNISSVVKDKEGGHWVTTLGAGLLYIPTLEVFNMSISDSDDDIGLVTSFLVHDNQLYFGNKAGDLFLVENLFDLPKKLGRSLNGAILDICYYNGIITSNFDLVTEKNGEIVFEVLKPVGRLKMIKIVDENNIMVVGGRALLFRDSSCFQESIPLKLGSAIFPNDITSLRWTSPESVYVGTLNGLYHVKGMEVQTPYFEEILKNKRINDFELLNPNQFIVATMGHGLIFINDDEYTTISKKDGLSGDLINTVLLQNDSTVWVGTTDGLDKLIFAQEENGIVVKSIYNYSNQDGLISNYIAKIVLWGDYVIVGTDKGISFFDADFNPSRDFVSDIEWDSIIVNGKKMDFSRNQLLSYNENEISINYTATQFNKPRKAKFYNYRLTSKGSKDSSWLSTNNRNVSFSDLNPGKYKFEIFPNTHKSNIQKNLKTITFEITPPFTDTLLFKLLILAVGAFGVWYFIKQREKRIFEKNELARLRQEHLLKLNNAQLTALRSQMNPHFIFNALNSIQNFVFKKDVRQANHFLTKFSNLIRKSLELSKLNVLPLAEELKFLNNYLELEQMRFPNHFDYKFHLPDNWEAKEIEVPSLIIQPILENSIRHGFKGIDYCGKIDIFIDDQSEGLNIKIVDNGIGLKAAERDGSLKKHKSFAMNILENRIQMINELNGRRSSYFTIKEREGSKKGLHGVIVNLFIAKSEADD